MVYVVCCDRQVLWLRLVFVASLFWWMRSTAVVGLVERAGCGLSERSGDGIAGVALVVVNSVLR